MRWSGHCQPNADSLPFLLPLLLNSRFPWYKWMVILPRIRKVRESGGIPGRQIVLIQQFYHKISYVSNNNSNSISWHNLACLLMTFLLKELKSKHKMIDVSSCITQDYHYVLFHVIYFRMQFTRTLESTSSSLLLLSSSSAQY